MPPDLTTLPQQASRLFDTGHQRLSPLVQYVDRMVIVLSNNTLTGLVTEPYGSLPSEMSSTAFRVVRQSELFANMMLTFQSPKLRKHFRVG